MSKWADIPCDVFFRMVNRLFYDDIIISGAVCKSWHSLLNSPEKFPLPPSCPWLMLAEQNEQSDNNNNEQNERCSFFKLRDTKLYDLKLPQVAGTRCFGTSFGWLLTIGTDLRINLLHPLSKHILCLPSQASSMTSNPRLKSFDIKQSWMDIKSSQRSFADIAFYKGKFYAVDHHGGFAVCHIDDNKKPRAKVVLPSLERINSYIQMHIQKYLVESLGDLLLMICFRGGVPMDESDNKGFDKNVNLYVTTGFTIKRLKRCTQEGTLFVGDNSSLSLIALSLNGIKPNYFYFTDDDLPLLHCTHNGGGFDMGMFSMENATIKPLYSGQSLPSFVPHFGISEVHQIS
ncbi:hypothetical protein ACB092_06G125000 [Castanea dentata]